MVRLIKAKARRWIIVLVAVGVVTAAVLAGCSTTQQNQDSDSNDDSTVATVDYYPDGRYKDDVADLPSAVNNDLNAETAEKNAPKTYVDRNGFTVQPTPNDDESYNNTYLNADNRGCTSCHTLEDALMSLPTYHGFIFNGYNTEQTFSQCVACHIWANPLKDTIHSTHMNSDLFKEQGGNCESCHYIDNNGNYLRWDYEKYNVLKGITDVPADSADVQVSYDQTTLTQPDQMFFKSIKEYGDDYNPIDWRTDDSYMDPDLYNNWELTIGGDVENPISMTLPELVDKFGTITTTMKGQCCINGVGNATIFNCEVTGVPMSAIIDYVKPNSNVNAVNVETEDPYPSVDTNYNFPYTAAQASDCLLVTQISGQTLPNSQGYPCALWVPRSSAACCYKVCTGFDFIQTTQADSETGYYLGGFLDNYDGKTVPADKPNSAVLNYPSGVVLDGVAGTPVDIEGFADAYDEPIQKVEYSFDHGATWIEMDTPNNDPTRWTYWRMNFTPPEPGSYLLTIRTTSTQADGTPRVCAYNTQFLLNVK